MSAGDGTERPERLTRPKIAKLIKLMQAQGLPIKNNGDFSFPTPFGVEHTNIYEESGYTVRRPEHDQGYGLWQILPVTPQSRDLSPAASAAAVARRFASHFKPWRQR